MDYPEQMLIAIIALMTIETAQSIKNGHVEQFSIYPKKHRWISLYEDCNIRTKKGFHPLDPPGFSKSAKKVIKQYILLDKLSSVDPRSRREYRIVESSFRLGVDRNKLTCVLLPQVIPKPIAYKWLRSQVTKKQGRQKPADFHKHREVSRNITREVRFRNKVDRMSDMENLTFENTLLDKVLSQPSAYISELPKSPTQHPYKKPPAKTVEPFELNISTTTLSQYLLWNLEPSIEPKRRNDTNPLRVHLPVKISPDTSNNTLNAETISPDTFNNTVNAVTISPATSNNTVNTVKISPNTSNNTLNAKTMSPDTFNNTVNAVTISPATSNNTVNTVKLSPNTSNNTSNAETISPDTFNNTVNAVTISPATSNNTVNTGTISPNTSNNTLNAKTISPDTFNNTVNAVAISTATSNNTVNTGTISPDISNNTVNAVTNLYVDLLQSPRNYSDIVLKIS